MVSDQNKPNSLKLLLIMTLAAVIVLVTVVMLYLSFRQEAFAKTQPYSVAIDVLPTSDGQLKAYYNYGYGYNEGHQQTFELISGQAKTVHFTVSAWKALHSLRIDSDKALNISSVKIQKNGSAYQAVQSPITVSKDVPLELAEVNHKLQGLAE